MLNQPYSMVLGVPWFYRKRELPPLPVQQVKRTVITERHKAYLRKHFASMTNNELAEKTGLKVSTITSAAARLGLKKNPETIARINSTCRINKRKHK